MIDGKVKYVSDGKGFLFVKTDDGDVFVHSSAFQPGEFEQVELGDSLTLDEIETGPKGKKALFASLA